MRLIHDGRPSELLLEGGQEIRQGQEFEVDDERGAYLLTEQPVRLIPAWDGEFATGGIVPALTRTILDAAAETGDTAALADGEVFAPAPTDNTTPREASTGEAQSPQGDDAA